MSDPDPPIYAELMHPIREAEMLAERALHHMHHPAHYASTSSNPPEGTTPVSALADVEAKIKDFADKITAGLEDITQNAVPVVHDASESLARLTASPIVGELEQLVSPLDPALEQAIAAIIRGAGDAAAKVASLSTPAETPAEPAPAEQVPTGIAV